MYKNRIVISILLMFSFCVACKKADSRSLKKKRVNYYYDVTFCSLDIPLPKEKDSTSKHKKLKDSSFDSIHIPPPPGVIICSMEPPDSIFLKDTLQKEIKIDTIQKLLLPKDCILYSPDSIIISIDTIQVKEIIN